MTAYDLKSLTRTVRTKTEICGCGCWVWTGALNNKGYASAKIKGRVVAVHRYAYEKFVGPIGDDGDDMTIDHLNCCSRACVNPAHMEVVTRSVNSERANATKWRGVKYDQEGNEVARADPPEHCVVVKRRVR